MKTRWTFLALFVVAAFALVTLGASGAALAGDNCGGCPHAKDGNCPHAKDGAAAAAAPKAFDKAPEVGTKATCPVMGNEFTVVKDTPRSEYQGKHYAFCCPGCKPKFDADPAKYTK
jgi:Cu+-exporting ATPase